MEFCVTGPNATCVRDWCRENAVQWMPEAFDIIEKTNTDLEIQMDALSPDFLRTVINQTISDEQVVEMHVENCAALGLDGKFTASEMVIKPCIIIAGLYSKNSDEPIDAEKWERWGFIEDDDFGGWSPRYVVFTPLETGKYRMSRVSRPTNTTTDTLGGIVSKEEAISIASNIMSNSMQNVSFMYAKLFFSFKGITAPWSFKKRKGLAAILNTVTRMTDEDAFAGAGWLIKTHPSWQESEWRYPPLGPRQPAWVGAVHVTCGHYVWHSVMHCSVRISEDPNQLNHPIIVEIITTW